MTNRFSIGDALGDALGLIRRHPLAVLVWGLVTAAPNVLVLAIGAEMGQLAPEVAMDAEWWRYQAISGLVSIAQLVLAVIVGTAAMRAILHGEGQGRAFFMRFGMDELWVAVSYIAMFVAVYAGMIVVGLAGVAAGLILWAVNEGVAIGLGVLIGIAGGVAVVWLMLRVSLIPAASVRTHHFAFVEGWRIAKGQTLRILGVSLAALVLVLTLYAAIILLAIIIALVLGIALPNLDQLGEMGQLSLDSGPQMWTLALIALIPASVLMGVINVLTYGPLASAVRQLAGPGDGARAANIG
ncbi:MAG: hypothetical protein EON91_11440 [Brevundimonas sp.]|uniref:hypothetical protein n=1 Tax=Brevundimonas sp. TaxID=1871086 RepID=UPI0012155155|nr:hypothetical protein [Brevundimonas sp.]RZJ16874.1 MAG: hypothetical protein EON91_11440 [Brevundimonas sp.]